MVSIATKFWQRIRRYAADSTGKVVKGELTKMAQFAPTRK
jgi:hypothetical protein